MKFDILHNFISPVTGRVLADPDYVLVGDRLGIATPSPMLIDIRLDLNNLRQKIKDIDFPELEYKQLWTGDINNKTISITKLNIDNLPNLTTNKVWRGNSENRPEEIELQEAPDDATYIIQIPNIKLLNAQVLSLLGTGMAKIIAGGAFAIAIPDEDYATKETLEKIRDETEIFKDQAETAAEEATASAEEATGAAAEATEAAVEATGAAAEATAAATEATEAAGLSVLGGIGSILDNVFGGGHDNSPNTTNVYNNTVSNNQQNNDLYSDLSDGDFNSSEQNIRNSDLKKITSIERDNNFIQSYISSASSYIEESLQQAVKFTDFIDQQSRNISLHAEAANESSFIAEDAAQQAASYLNILNNTGITLIGDITGNGPLDSTIATSFRQNPKFYGSEAIQIPYGSTIDRPDAPSIGMLRYNIDVGLEYYNNSTWAHIASNPVQIGIPYATDMVYGVIGNVNGLFDGFSSLERDLNIRVKSSYYTGELKDSSSASLSLLDRYNNGYINKVISSSTGYFDYLLQQQDNGIKTDLLKFDNKIDEFIFHKPISYNGKNIIKYDEAVDIVTGVLNNSNGLFSGFATDNQEIDFKIKTAHFAEDNYSSSSLSFLNRYNNGYVFNNKTNSDWSNDFSLNSINNEIKTELLKYDGLGSKFIFNKLVEVPAPINDEDAANKYYVDNLERVRDVLGTNGQIKSSGGDYPQISLANTGVIAGSYSLANINVDSTGRITQASEGQAVTSITASNGLTGGVITDTGFIGIANTGVIAGSYSLANINVDSTGRITQASEGQAVTSITASNGLTGGVITDTGFIGIANTGVIAGSYSLANLNIGSDGRIYSAESISTIGGVNISNNTISTDDYWSDLKIDAVGGEVNIESTINIKNNKSFKIYDTTNYRYTEIKSPNAYSQSSVWKLPEYQGQPDQFVKMGYNNQLEWTNITTDPGVYSITAGFGLDGGTITASGEISLSNSGVVAGAYNAASMTVDTAGRVTHAEESYRMEGVYFDDNFLYTLGDPNQGSAPPIVIDTPLINNFGVYLTYGGYDVGSVARKNDGGYLYVNSQQQLIFQNSNNSYVIAG